MYIALFGPDPPGSAGLLDPDPLHRPHSTRLSPPFHHIRSHPSPSNGPFLPKQIVFGRPVRNLLNAKEQISILYAIDSFFIDRDTRSLDTLTPFLF